MNANRLQIPLLFLFAAIHWIILVRNTAVSCAQKDGRIAALSSRLHSMFSSTRNAPFGKQKLCPTVILCHLLEGQCYCSKNVASELA